MTESLKLGLQLGYWMGQGPGDVIPKVKDAEAMGYDSVWTAESYGSAAFSWLAWIGSHTSTIKLSTGLVQLSARTPTATAMEAMTIDYLSGGRLQLGLGVSGPQVVEGWYGVPFPKPLARTREYVQILRDIWRREAPVTNSGEHYPLPYPGGTGLGKPLKATFHPLRSDIPVFLGAEGLKNVELAAEIADGWLPIFFHIDNAPAVYAPALAGAVIAAQQQPTFRAATDVVVIDAQVVAKALQKYLDHMEAIISHARKKART